MMLSNTEISAVISHHFDALNQMNIPSFYEPESSYPDPEISPIITRFKLKRISQDLLTLRKSFHDQQEASKIISPLQSLLDEKLYVNEIMMKKWQRKHEQKLSDQNESKIAPISKNDGKEEEQEKGEELNNNENLSQLRQRLLSTSNTSVLDKNNDYHESIQEDILTELTGFAQTLKDSAITLSNKIVEDSKILDKTSDNLLKNSSLMQVVDKNLSSYVSNKNAVKIGFLIKVFLLVFLMFFAMTVLIKIFPKM